MSKKRSRRLRKKLHLGEFQEYGFAVTFELSSQLTDVQMNSFWDDFIVQAIEQTGLIYGGGCSGYASLAVRGSVTEQQRAHVEAWFAARDEVHLVMIGKLSDAYYSMM